VIESTEVAGRLDAVRSRISRACARAGRSEDEVLLIGVTKKMPPGAVAAASAAGLRDFGENYVQELKRKRPAAPLATWHFVGRVQANKAAPVAENADLIHTAEPGRAVRRLAAVGEERGRPVPCLIEVDFTGHRVGVPAGEAEAFVRGLMDEGGLDVRGLMTVAPQDRDPRPAFAALRELRDRLGRTFPTVAELSMGMSEDLETAVEEGATMVRVGTAIFGPRR
jgi:pyridoxal phosphate enzyme (YggS family)